MVFHKNDTEKAMDIGILREPKQHVPRLLTITNGVLAKVRDLREYCEPGSDPRFWRLEVKKPQVTTISLRQVNGDFDRKTAGSLYDQDFRWIMDLEDKDFYERDLTNELPHTDLLFPILRIDRGNFYTKLKSPVLNRDPTPKPFGSVAAVIGCDISYEPTGTEPVGKEIIAELKSDRASIFKFLNKPNTIYEITNTPPDVILDRGVGHAHSKSKLVGPTTDDHFHHYYDLFDPKPSPIFSFTEADPDPDPEPTLCGVSRLGTRKDPLK